MCRRTSCHLSHSISSPDFFPVSKHPRWFVVVFNMSLDNLTFKSHTITIAKEAPSLILSPWRVFDKVFASVAGYPASEFEYVYGSTPLSTLTETLVIITLYLVVIFGGREVMRERRPIELNGLFKIHNLFLSVLSAGLLLLIVEQIVPQLWRDGLYHNICTYAGATQPLVTLYYVSHQESDFHS